MIGLKTAPRQRDASSSLGADISCPEGQARNFNADTGETWCEDASGKRYPTLETQKASMGVLGWGAIAAGLLLLASWMWPKRRRAGANRRRSRRRMLLPRYR